MNKETNRQNKAKSTLAWILEVTGTCKRGIAWMLLIQILLSGLGLAWAWLFRDVVDYATSENLQQFAEYAVKLLLTLAFMLTFQALLRHMKAYYRAQVDNHFKSRLFSTLLSKEYASVSAIHSGEWMSRLNSDAAITAEGVTEILPDVVGMLVRLIGALISLAYLLPDLVVLLLPGGFFLVLLNLAFQKKIKALHKALREADGVMRIYLLEHLTNLSIVHSFSQEERSQQGAKDNMAVSLNAQMKRARFSNFCNTGFGVIMQGGYALGVIYCGYKILSGEMSYGTLVVVTQLVGQLQSPFSNLAGYIPKYYAMLASAERLREAEKWPDDCTGRQRTSEEIWHFYQKEFSGLSLVDVSFSYRKGSAESEINPLVLNKVNLSFPKGEFVAFTGPSGCGKSTILKLLMSFYSLDSGERLILTEGGVSIALDATWRGLFAYVPQGNQLMAGTIREAVTFGEKSGIEQEDKIWKALSVACADEFVRKQENGLDTRIGERGQGLSEGQLQRLAIARAIFSGRPILLLDEATSALDEDTETALLRNLRSMTDCTVFIITHRPAALSYCDQEVKVSSYGGDNTVN